MSKKVLLVDDEAGFTKLLKMNLERTGKFDVRIENNSTLAVSAARAFQPDVVLLDVVMPDMDGGDVEAQFSKDPKLSQVPIIMLTALVDSAELPEGTVGQSGSHMVLPKPVQMDLLMAALDEVLAS